LGITWKRKEGGKDERQEGEGTERGHRDREEM